MHFPFQFQSKSLAAFLLAASCFLQSPAYSFPSSKELCNNYYLGHDAQSALHQTLSEVSELKLVSCELLQTTNRLFYIILVMSIIALGRDAYAPIRSKMKSAFKTSRKNLKEKNNKVTRRQHSR
ncbi:MAG: hypothetical protein OXI08_04565 [Cyanobacteria bacterium MAG IRC4_bin_6]|nr:hypothetical protein [Cyanobacteria bacterium MAG IRC4_bin_6]